MSRLELLLAYGKEFGHSLSHATTLADAGDEEYVAWLEEKVLYFKRYNQHLLDGKQPHLY